MKLLLSNEDIKSQYKGALLGNVMKSEMFTPDAQQGIALMNRLGGDLLFQGSTDPGPKLVDVV